MIGNGTWRVVFLVIRVAGPTLVVPVMEELFYRDFLMRAFIGGSRFEDVEPGTFVRGDWKSWLSVVGTAAVFTASHIQRPSAFLWGLMMGTLMVRTKSLGACIVAHAVTNLVLYLWVIWSGDWQFM
jgi:CAAX prenyl protease-like protein